jgi:hypothetical protein
MINNRSIGKLAVAVLAAITLACAPAFARFGGGGRSFGGGGFGGGFSRPSSSGFGGGLRPRSIAPPPAQAPSGGFGSSQGRSFGGGFGGGNFGAPRTASGGSFGSRSRGTQSFGRPFQSGSTYTSNRRPQVLPTYNGYRASYQNYGGNHYYVYHTSPWAAFSLGYLAPHPWWMGWGYNPFFPSYYFYPPSPYGYGYVPGGFNFWHLILGIIEICLVIWIIRAIIGAIRESRSRY